MTDLCREQNLPDPSYRLGKETVCIVFKKAQKENVGGLKDDLKDDLKELTERQLLIYRLIQADDLITIQELTVKTSASDRSVRRDIQILRQKGLLKREGGRKQGHWVILYE